ncbi:hypothetical protein NDU88_000327 [Pleurodeles waltl]|uniref:Uncharacterized protein n=1 Tax=Pleurodeles waltl TaxID=8319 RepID=A0AAV7S5C2_PLEWA|nr:hypothetical protein NDU88_000327 [Pleurodeles waltl]
MLLSSPSVPASRSSFLRGGVHRAGRAAPPPVGGLQIAEPSPGTPCTLCGTLACGGLLSRRAPVPGPGPAYLDQAREPSSYGSPSPGFPSVPRVRCHEARVSERGTNESGRTAPLPAGALDRGARSRHFERRIRHSRRKRPRQQASPDLWVRRDAVSAAAILKNCCSGRGQRSRRGLCRYWHRRSLRGPGARGSG